LTERDNMDLVNKVLSARLHRRYPANQK